MRLSLDDVANKESSLLIPPAAFGSPGPPTHAWGKQQPLFSVPQSTPGSAAYIPRPGPGTASYVVLLFWLDGSQAHTVLPAWRGHKNEQEKQPMILHGQTVIRMKETQFQVSVVPVPEQVLKPRVEVKLVAVSAVQSLGSPAAGTQAEVCHIPRQSLHPWCKKATWMAKLISPRGD